MKKTLGMISLSMLLLAGCQTTTSDTDNTGEQEQRVDAQQQVEAQPQQNEKDEQEKQDEADAQAFDALSDELKILIYASTMDDRITDKVSDNYTPMYAYYEWDDSDIYIHLTSGVGRTYTISHLKEREDEIKPIQIINVDIIGGQEYHSYDITKNDIDPIDKVELYRRYKQDQQAFDTDEQWVEQDDVKDDFIRQTSHSGIAIRGENDKIEDTEPRDETGDQKYDKLSFEDQIILNAYALIGRVESEHFEDEGVPNFQGLENADFVTLYYSVEDSDIYYVMAASNGAKHVMAHAVLTDGGIIPVQVTGYDVTTGSSYGDKNWLKDQEEISKEDMYLLYIERLDEFREKMKDPYQPTILKNSHYVYLEFLAALRSSVNGIEFYNENMEDYSELALIMAARSLNHRMSYVPNLAFNNYEKTEDGYDAVAIDGSERDSYHFVGDKIASDLIRYTPKDHKLVYGDGESTHAELSLSEVEEVFEANPAMYLTVAYFGTHSQEINAMREAADVESGLRLID